MIPHRSRTIEHLEESIFFWDRLNQELISLSPRASLVMTSAVLALVAEMAHRSYSYNIALL